MDELLDTSAAALIGEAIGDEKDSGSDAEGVDLAAMDLDAMARALMDAENGAEPLMHDQSRPINGQAEESRKERP